MFNIYGAKKIIFLWFFLKFFFLFLMFSNNVINQKHSQYVTICMKKNFSSKCMYVFTFLEHESNETQNKCLDKNKMLFCLSAINLLVNMWLL